MHYKIEGTIRKNKNRFIIFAILWLFMAIVIVMPITYAQHQAGLNRRIQFWNIHRHLYKKLYNLRHSNSEA